MALQTPEFLQAYGVEVAAKSLYIPGNGSRFEPLIGKPGDGSSPHCAIVDEYHEHDTDEQVDTMVTGMGAREQPMLFVITTSGTNLESPCFAMEQDAKKVLDGVAEDEQLFAIVYTIDADVDDWTSEAALRKANPNYDVSVSGEFLKGQIAEALRSPRKQNIVKTKHLDVWCNAREAWMNMQAWNACADAPAQETFAGEPAWLAFDLSSKLDLTAKATIHARDVGGVRHYYGFVRSYLPEDTASDPTKQHYAEWLQTGRLVATEGSVVDYRVIGDEVRDDARAFRLQACAYDPWNAQQLATELLEDGIPMVEVPQRVSHLSEPMKELEALVIAGRFHHDGNPVLTWAVSNVVSREDPNGNVFPRKERPEGKIDPAVALINAIGRAIAAPAETQSVYETRGVLAFG
jgi:phage terminase large subunit-like protein